MQQLETALATKASFYTTTTAENVARTTREDNDTADRRRKERASRSIIAASTCCTTVRRWLGKIDRAWAEGTSSPDPVDEGIRDEEQPDVGIFFCRFAERCYRDCCLKA